MARRRFVAQMVTWPLAALVPITTFPEPRSASLKIVLKSAWGSDDPTKAAFPFSHANALSEAGHAVQIFLLGEAVGLMRRSVADAVVPVGWPPVGELLGKVAARKIPIYACGTCARARGVVEADLANWGAKYGSPQIFVSLVEWADHIITE
jgi:sulfur relay (sulfurtransferase) complex TusBCD TusD component (DsrE family)